MARLIYGCGLRLQERLQLRIKDIDFEKGLVIVRVAKAIRIEELFWLRQSNKNLLPTCMK